MNLTAMIDDLIRQADAAAAPAWIGAPLRFHQEYWHTTDLTAAFDRWVLEHGRQGSIPRSHMWHESHWNPRTSCNGHILTIVNADLRVNVAGPEVTKHSGPSVLLARGQCDTCQWMHTSSSENDVVAAWYDHALPGWRDLPTLPAKLGGRSGPVRHTPRVDTWLEANYPEHMRIPGAPIFTPRGGLGGRSVPAYSPYGGYNIAAPESTERTRP